MNASPVRNLAAFWFLAATLVAGTAAPECAWAGNPARPALWKVTDADTTIYLFGTIHVLRPSLYWFTGPVRDAMRASDELVLELNLPKPAERRANYEKLIARTSRKDATPMVDRLPADKRDTYSQMMKELRLPPDAFDAMPTWMAGMTLTVAPLVKAGYDPERGVDNVLALLAADFPIPVTGLETVEQQFGFFHGLPEQVQVEFLVATMDDAETIVPQVNSMIADWASGDVEALAALLNENIGKSPELYKLLLGDRNKRWADWIVARMRKPGTVLVAVGAGHLAGPESLQDQLSERKLKVVRVDR